MSEPDDVEFGTLHNDPAECPMWHDWCRCTPQNVLVRARELREKRAKAYQAYQAAYNRYWNDSTSINKALWDQAQAEWNTHYEEYRQFLVAAGAPNLDAIIGRANRAALTPAEAEQAYNEAEPVPLSAARIQEIVDFVTKGPGAGTPGD